MASIIVKSKGGLFPHTHTLSLDAKLFDNLPAEGITLVTSSEYSLIFKHKHQVSISKENLEKIRDGQNLIVYDNDKKRHSFSFNQK